MARSKKTSRLKGIFSLLFALGLLGAFIGTLVFLYLKSQDPPPEYTLETPTRADIVQKTVAAGSIVPRREVQLKPRVSGIVSSLAVKPGDVVEKGALIAEIRIVPNIAGLTLAQGNVRTAQIAVEHAEREVTRARSLVDAGVSSGSALADQELQRDLRKAELRSALDQVRVLRDGATQTSAKNSNTNVRATVAGTVLEVPVEVGASVIESNTFNEGTTIATVADMSDMIFSGRIDESDVGRIREGMDVQIRIGALDERHFEGKLEYIAPKGKTVDGALQFEIRAALETPSDVVVRAGYSANAEIVLEERTQVLSLPERLVRFEGRNAYVFVETRPGETERREVKLGISDGIQIEVVSGVEESTQVRKPEADSALAN